MIQNSKNYRFCDTKVKNNVDKYLELFRDSYNAIHSAKTIETQANEIGYEVKWSSDESYAANSISGLSTLESLYVISDSTNAGGMWIASTNAYSEYNMFDANHEGGLTGTSYSSPNQGARPIVCLNSNIKIEKQENGTYLIID